MDDVSEKTNIKSVHTEIKPIPTDTVKEDTYLIYYDYEDQW